MPELFEDLELRRAEVERHRENSTRLAQAYGRFTSNGQGSIVFPDRLGFGLTFIEEPYTSWCPMIDVDELEDLLDNSQASRMQGQSNVAAFPMITPYVVDWDQDDRGFYVGAWCGVRVWWPPTDAVLTTASPEIVHNFTFTGKAIKDVPLEMEGD